MSNVEPRNGRWPVEFLKNQRAQLEKELANDEKWSKDIAGGLKEPAEKRVTSSNASDCAETIVRHEVSAIISESSNLKIAKIRMALAQIYRDLKSNNSHEYGKCTDCQGFIRFNRLIASPWADKCVDCQTVEDGSRRDHKRLFVFRLGGDGAKTQIAKIHRAKSKFELGLDH